MYVIYVRTYVPKLKCAGIKQEQNENKTDKYRYLIL